MPPTQLRHGVVMTLYQVMEVVKFVCDFITSNPFIVCSEELSYIKKQLLRDGDELKVKQKAGSLHYRAHQDRLVKQSHWPYIQF